MTPLVPGVQIALLLLVIPAAIFDIRSRRIPNWLNLSGLILGFALNIFLADRVTAGLKHSALGMLFAFAVYFVLYLIHAMGAGDVKMMAAVGSIVGPADWLGIFVITAIIGGVFALILMFSKGRARKTLWNVGYLLSEVSHFRAPYMTREELDVKSAKAARLPHGFTIAIGCVIFIAAGYLVK
jgi:prepilin peptidase CpaA